MRNQALKGVKDTISVRNIPFSANETDLGQLFVKLLNKSPKEVRIITNATGVSRGYSKSLIALIVVLTFFSKVWVHPFRL